MCFQHFAFEKFVEAEALPHLDKKSWHTPYLYRAVTATQRLPLHKRSDARRIATHHVCNHRYDTSLQHGSMSGSPRDAHINHSGRQRWSA